VRVWVMEYRRVLRNGLVSATLWLFVLNEMREGEREGEDKKERRKKTESNSNKTRAERAYRSATGALKM
jgi:hypothetical protein